MMYNQTNTKICVNKKQLSILCNENIYTYLKMVYPNSNLIRSVDLNFLYNCAPNDLKQIYSPLIDPEKTTNYSPVNLYDTWRPIWYPENCYTVNLYPPKNWMNFEYLNKYGDNSVIEGLHTRDDNPYYTVWGFWVYATKGTGVFYNLGKTLKAYNKIDSLYLLGVSIPDIAAFLMDKNYFYNPDKPQLKILDLAKEKFPDSTNIDSMIRLVEYIIKKNDIYDYDRINNTADVDNMIVFLAKSKNYDSVQLQVQANGMGGWCFEVIFTNVNVLSKYNELTWPSWPQIENRMTVNDPNNELAPIKCRPNIVDDSVIVSCKQQNLCKLSNPNPYYK